MNKPYILLSRFPSAVLDYVKTTVNSNIDLQNLHILRNDINNIQGDNLVIKKIKGNILNYTEFRPEVYVFISKPNMGMATIHTDKSRYYSLNIPIVVDNNKSAFVAGKSLEISDYLNSSTFTINNKSGMTFLYEPDLYDFVQLYSPILINTKLPHSWTNYSDNFRIVASLSFNNAVTYSEAVRFCKDWL